IVGCWMGETLTDLLVNALLRKSGPFALGLPKAMGRHAPGKRTAPSFPSARPFILRQAQDERESHGFCAAPIWSERSEHLGAFGSSASVDLPRSACQMA